MVNTVKHVISDELDYYGNRDRLEDLKEGLSDMTSVQSGSVDFWLSGYTAWLNTSQDVNSTLYLNEGDLNLHTTCLFSIYILFLC